MNSLLTKIQSRYIKIESDIEECIDIVYNYINILANIKAQNITIPSVPESFLDTITAYNDTLIEIDQDISEVTESSVSDFRFVYSLVALGLTFIGYVVAYSYMYYQHKTMPRSSQIEAVVRIKRNDAKSVYYGVTNVQGGNMGVYKVTDPTSKKLVSVGTNRDIGIVNTKWDKFMDVYERLNRKIGVAINVAINLVYLGLCVWEITKVNKHTQEAERQLEDISNDLDNLEVELTNSTEILSDYENATTVAVDAYISNFDQLVEMILASDSFSAFISSDLKTSVQSVGNTATTYENVVSQMNVIESFLDNYRVSTKSSYNTLNIEVSVAEGMAHSLNAADITKAVQNKGVVDVNEYVILEKISRMSNASTWDSVNLDCIRDGSINSLGKLYTYRAQRKSNDQLMLGQDVVKDFTALAEAGVSVGRMRATMGSTLGTELSADQVLTFIANLDEWKNEQQYPKQSALYYYAQTVNYFDLAPYRYTSSEC